MLLGIVVSPAWSFDPVLSVRAAGSIVLTTAVGAMLGLAFRSSAIIDLLVGACALWLVSGGVATLALPDLAFQPYPVYPQGSALGWAGLQGNKNLTGSTAAIACLVFAALSWAAGSTHGSPGRCSQVRWAP